MSDFLPAVSILTVHYIHSFFQIFSLIAILLVNFYLSHPYITLIFCLILIPLIFLSVSVLHFIISFIPLSWELNISSF